MTKEQSHLARLYFGTFVACVVSTILSILFVDRAVATWSHAVLQRPAPLEWLTHIIDPFLPTASITLIGVAIAAVFGWRPGPFGRAVIAVCIAVLIAILFKDQLKLLFGRTWPETWTDKNPSWIHDGIYRFEPLHGGKGWMSLPSGHMAVITAPCTALWLLAPRLWRWLWAALIFAVALGLVASNYHFIGDIIPGTFLGWACGVGAVALTRGLVTPPEARETALP
ncbi:MAG: phosphatase PAP2 family protein [Methylobacteriaceae bacterium]|nr:phosphatase PAP2 family protein [Methylobacteriaceae bacterium]